MIRKPPSPTDSNQPVADTAAEVNQFLKSVAAKSGKTQSARAQGRLIFAMDATASRQHSWDRAMALQSDMFLRTEQIGALQVQLVFYRGFRECRASRWVNDATALVRLMSKVNCIAGRTQLSRVLEHGLAEARQSPVQALVFVGDAFEENIDTVADLAGRLKLRGLPAFVFQEGNDLEASSAFASVARLSGGAHCHFNQNSAHELGELLNAVAAYAAGGEQALAQLSGHSGKATQLLEQIR